MEAARLAELRDRACAALLAHRDPAAGSFRGRLSSSALATAVSSMALAMADRSGDDPARAAAGHAWLLAHQNEDGGWGDTVESPSNLSTTALAWASLAFAPGEVAAAAAARAGAPLAAEAGGLEALPAALAARYGRDRTFSVPILMTCALAGRLGENGWRRVASLPFELAALPQRWFRFLRLPTVSYALPALIAIGQARHHHRPTRLLPLRLLRNALRSRTRRVLAAIQPETGGYLEATPLTSFVVMSLLSMDHRDDPVVAAGLAFLVASQREDGAWPIDTNLDTWTTTLAVGALAPGDSLDARSGAETRAWLLAQQYRTVHPYTAAPPGGWAWTDLPGGVPDADDTAGALLALRRLAPSDEPPHPSDRDAAAAGVRWLLDLQNRDGGAPTFCRGWGRLPFDRSSPDLTAHALRAWAAWRDDLAAGDEALAARLDRAVASGIGYLLRAQRDDGAWIPLWFGHQAEPRQENPLYGTTRVLRAVLDVEASPAAEPGWRAAGARALGWLLSVQDAGGGFGAAPGVPPSIEETAQAVEALSAWELAARAGRAAPVAGVREASDRGLAWLAAATGGARRFPASPIGLYFAKLWYSEALYPIIFTVSALELAVAARATAGSSTP